MMKAVLVGRTRETAKGEANGVFVIGGDVVFLVTR